MREAGDGFVSLDPRLGGHGLAFEATLEVVIYVSSAHLTTYSFGTSATWQLRSVTLFYQSMQNRKYLGHNSVSLDRGDQDKHNGEEFTSNR